MLRRCLWARCQCTKQSRGCGGPEDLTFELMREVIEEQAEQGRGLHDDFIAGVVLSDACAAGLRKKDYGNYCEPRRVSLMAPLDGVIKDSKIFLYENIETDLQDFQEARRGVFRLAMGCLAGLHVADASDEAPNCGAESARDELTTTGLESTTCR